MNEEKFKEIVSDEKCNFVESVDKMVELRTEAEIILMEKYAFPKWQEKIIVDAMLDFHAQQSKERDSELIGFVELADLNATQTSKGYWYGSAIKIEPKKAVKTAELFIIYKSITDRIPHALQPRINR